MSTSRTNSLNSRDRSLNGLGDGGIYNFSRGSVRKEYSLPALNNEAHNHTAFSPPPFKLSCATSNDLSTDTSSFDMVFFSTNAEQNLGSSATCDVNVFNDGIQHELDSQQRHKGSLQDVGMSMKTSHQFCSADNTPITSKRRHLSNGKLEITGNGNQRSCSINNGYSALNNDTLSHGLEPDTLLNSLEPDTLLNSLEPDTLLNSLEPDTLLNGLDVEFELHSYPEDTSSFCTNIHVTGIAPCADGAVEGILKDIPSDIKKHDRVKFTQNMSTDDLQTSRSSCRNMAVTSEIIKSSTLPVSSSSRNKRQRQIEIDQVHQVYKQIAPHCDQVRQKAWPRVKRFLKDVEPGSMVVDVGCGNGRYLKINSSIFKLGCDLCPPFVDQARSQGHEVMLADNITLPYRDGTFDAVISIGVIHHFASLERRIRAISELSRILSPGGRLMIYVWAFEQIHRKFESQDVLIPWIKPEVKDHTRRNTIPCLSEQNSASINSIKNHTCADDTALSTSGRRQHQSRYKSNISAGERCRSKSLGDGASPMSACRDHSIAGEDLMSKQFGVFDKRETAYEEDKTNIKDVIDDENTVFEDAPKCVSQKEQDANSGNEDLRQVSKWPGQLVSECKKLGKFLRSLSSKSDSQSNGESDLGECSIHGLVNESLIECSTNVCVSTEFNNDSRTTENCLNNYSTEIISIDRVLKKDERDIDPEHSCTHCFRNIAEAASSVSMPCSTTDKLYRCVCDLHVNTASILTPYHNVHKSPNFTEYTSDSETVPPNLEISHVNCFTQSVPACHLLNPAGDSNQVTALQNTHLTSLHHPIQIYDNSMNVCTTTANLQQPLHGCENSDNMSTTPVVLHQPIQVYDNSFNRNITLSGKQQSIQIYDNSPNRSTTFIDLHHSISVYENSNQNALVSNETNCNMITCGSDLPETSSTSFAAGVTPESVTCEETSATNSDKTITNNHLDNNKEFPQLKDECFLGAQDNSVTCEGTYDKSLENKLQISSVQQNSHEASNLQIALLKHRNGGNTKCQHFLDTNINLVGGYFQVYTKNSEISRSNTSTEVNYGASDLDDGTDFLDSDSVFSLKQDNFLPQNKKLNNDLHSVVDPMQNSNLYQEGGAIQKQTNIESDDLKCDDAILKDESLNDKRKKERQTATSLHQEITPFRATLKSILHKLTHYLHLNSKHYSKTYRCYQGGKRPESNCAIESDSSDSDTPETSFSSHSSCYPALFAVSKDRANSEKRATIPGTDLHNVENCRECAAFKAITDTSLPESSDLQLNLKKDARFGSLTIRTPESIQDLEQNFVKDALKTSEQSVKDGSNHSPSEDYTFAVENLSLVPLKKESFFNVLVHKWSGIFKKGVVNAQRQKRLSYTTASMSSSNEDDTLNISLLENSQSDVSENKSLFSVSLKRPNSLDFNKKRTRRKGRRPAPRRDYRERVYNSTEYKVQNKEKMEHKNTEKSATNIEDSVQNDRPLTLSDAMTLLGDGATEESIERRLDISAKNIFLQMKRMNFAIRKFPMSSVDSDTNDDGTREIPGSHTQANNRVAVEENVQMKPQTLIMRRRKQIFDSHRGFSDSVTSKAAALRKDKATLQRQKASNDEDCKNIMHPLERQNQSEDLETFFETCGIQRCKHYSQLLVSRSSDVNRELYTPPETLTGSQEDYPSFHEQMNNDISLSAITNTANCCNQETSDITNTANCCNQETIRTLDSEKCVASPSEAGVNDDYQTNDTEVGLNKQISIDISLNSFKMFDGDKLRLKGLINESTVKDYLKQSHYKTEIEVANGNASLQITCNQSVSHNPLNESLENSSTNQNNESKTFDNQSNLNERGTDNSLSRYYHVFKKGELDHLVTSHVPSLKIVDTFYDHANWCIIAEKV